MSDREVMQQALEALENCGGLTKNDAIRRVTAINALEAALAEQRTYTFGWTWRQAVAYLLLWVLLCGPWIYLAWSMKCIIEK